MTPDYSTSLPDDTGLQALQIDFGPAETSGAGRAQRVVPVDYRLAYAIVSPEALEPPALPEPALEPAEPASDETAETAETGEAASDNEAAPADTPPVAVDVAPATDAPAVDAAQEDATPAPAPEARASDSVDADADDNADTGEREGDTEGDNDNESDNESDSDGPDGQRAGEGEGEGEGDRDTDTDGDADGGKSPDQGEFQTGGRRRRRGRRSRRGRRNYADDVADPRAGSGSRNPVVSSEQLHTLPPRPIPPMRSLLEGRGSVSARDLMELADRARGVADYQEVDVTWRADGIDLRLRLQRHVLIPNVQVHLTVDGNAWLPRHEMPGHIEATVSFWTSVGSLRRFADVVRSIARAGDARAGSGRRRGGRGRSADGVMDGYEAPPRRVPVVDNPDDILPQLFYWEHTDDLLKDETARARDEDNWERKNDDWLASFEDRERRRRKHGDRDRKAGGAGRSGDDADDDDDDDEDEVDESAEARGAVLELGGEEHQDVDELNGSDSAAIADLPEPEVVDDDAAAPREPADEAAPPSDAAAPASAPATTDEPKPE
ncbi:MAG: hypothetical protein AB7K09_04260 [Planctomycetota bacterium]